MYSVAMLSVLTRFAIRALRRHKYALDDLFVLIAAITLTIGLGVLFNYLDSVYLAEAMFDDKVIPNRDEVEGLLKMMMWTQVFVAMSWTCIFAIKFAFLHLFHALIIQLSRRVTVYFWTVVVFMVVNWGFLSCEIFIKCHYFGAEAAKRTTGQYSGENYNINIVVQLLGAVLDILCDMLVISIPIIVLWDSRMRFTQKVGVAAILSLSAVMIVTALIRVIGFKTTTRSGVWATYWQVIETCVAVIMASVIVIRSVFVRRNDHEVSVGRDNLGSRLRKRISSILRLSKQSNHKDQQNGGQNDIVNPSRGGGLRIPTQALTRGTLRGMRTLIRGGNKKKNESEIGSRDTAYLVEEMDYHKVRKQDMQRDSPA